MRYAAFIPLMMLLGAAHTVAAEKKRFVLSLLLKAAASLLFVLTGLLSLTVRAVTFRAAMPLMPALSFGALGDILLEIPPLDGGRRRFFFAGAFSFFFGHLFYLCLLSDAATGARIHAAAAACVLGIFMSFLIYRKRRSETYFVLLSSAYLVAVTAVAAFGTASHLLHPGDPLCLLYMAGGICFAVSDTILLFRVNAKERPFLQGLTLILFYYLAQGLLALTPQLM